MLETAKKALSFSFHQLLHRSETAAYTRPTLIAVWSLVLLAVVVSGYPKHRAGYDKHTHSATMVLLASLIAGQAMFTATLRSYLMATLVVPLHAPAFHYMTSRALAWARQATSNGQVVHPLPQPPWGIVYAGIYVFGLEFACLFSFSLFCAVLQGLLALSLVSFSAWMMVGWITVYGKLLRVFCSSDKRSSDTPALRYAHHLQKLAEDASRAAALQQTQAASELIEVRLAHLTLIVQLWLDTCVRQPNTGLAAVAQRLMEYQDSLSPSHPAFRSAYLAARSLRASLVSEQARRGTYARTVRDETTTTSSIPFSKTLLLATLLTPILAHPRYPNTWNDLEPPAKLASSSAWEDLLECTIRYFDDALCHAPSQKDEDVAVQQLERVLDDTATRWRAVEAEKKAHEAILEALQQPLQGPKPALAFLPALEFAITLIIAFRMFRRMSLPEPIRGIDRWSRRADAIGDLIGFAFALRAALTVRQAVYVRAPLASSDAWRGLKQSWYALLHTSSDKIIYQSARWMFLFMPLSFPARWLSPLTLLPFLLEAADSMVSEQLDRYTPPTLTDEPKVFIQRLSGIFLQTFLPLPTLKHLFVKPDVETLSAVFLTPFNLEATNPTDPSEWPALNELGTLAPRLPPPHPALLGFLHALECFVVATAVLGIGSSGRRVDLEELVGVALEEVRLRRRAIEAEQKAHEAILEAVLAWKARKEGR
ncbi:hypothetical protein JCM8097_003452 [Rhodosporidiobolus ruineniae]